ncbi:MAG TPA: signal peptidase II [Rhizomicrobium sp.]|nr:signal peptidase II [Rhizomicrobium sp.]
MTPRQLGFLTAAVALVADQAVKLVMLYGFGFADMARDARIFVLPVFDLVMWKNSGISFGWFSSESPAGIAALITVELLVVAALGAWMWTSARRVFCIGLGLVIGGALGNLADRFIHGWVADFFFLHAFGWNFFACNPADIMISAGVLLLIYDSAIDTRAPERQGAG